jgi:hypothetical protein
MALPFMLTDESLTVQFSKGQVKTISANSPHFAGIVDAIRKDVTEAEVLKLFDLAEAVKKFSCGEVQIVGNEVHYGGEVIKNSVADRVVRFMALGLPWKPLAAFLKNLLGNISKRSIDTLYSFLEHESLAITDDGCFLAYKAVRNDWTDKHSGTFLNTIGNVLEMPRNKVCDDPSQGCSYGFTWSPAIA